MRTFKLSLHYLGTRYQGWQVQPDRPTIQGHVEAALTRLLGEKVRVVGAGRTDAGVHARGQVASFASGSPVPPRGILLGANHLLPEDIRIMSVEEARPGFHARHDAVTKDYAYRFSTSPVLSPFLAPTVTSLRATPDFDRMAEAASRFVGENDLMAFCGPEGRLKNTRRIVSVSSLTRENGEVWAYRITANGFLQYLVRNIVGTLFDIGRGRIPLESLPEILASRDRKRAGPTAPPQGLTLERVTYPSDPAILATPPSVW